MSNDDSPGAARHGDELFQHFAQRLIGLARLHLDARLQQKEDPEDVVQSVYKSFFLRYGQVRFEEEDLAGLWSLLTVITLRKCADRVRHYRAERRSVSREAAAADSAEGPAWGEALTREPTPEHAATLTETVEHLMSRLDPDERPVLELSLQGYSTQEISQQLGRAERTVRRLRMRVRKQLERMQLDSAV